MSELEARLSSGIIRAQACGFEATARALEDILRMMRASGTFADGAAEELSDPLERTHTQPTVN